MLALRLQAPLERRIVLAIAERQTPAARVCSRRRVRRAAIAAGTLLQGAEATITTQTFAPVADAYVNQNKPNTNYGTNQKLKVQASPTLRS